MITTPAYCHFGRFSHYVLFALFSLFSFSTTFAQCTGFPATVAASDCSLYPSLTSNTSVGAGQVLGICTYDNTVHTFSNINLNGGRIHICADAIINGTWNSGTIVVECGATLYFPSGVVLNNNASIINYGTVQITGDLNFQNTNNVFYNESDSSRLLVSGNILTAQNNGQNGYLKNNGFVSVGGTLSALPGGFFCLGPRSQIVCNNFTYMQNCGGPSNRFQRVSNTNTATIRYANSASLRGTVTNNNSIEIWRQTGATLNLNGCGSWGSAILLNNAPAIPTRPEPDAASCAVPNCRTVAIILPVEMEDFDVEQVKRSSHVSWKTISERNNDHFEVMRSSDGLFWQSIGSLQGKGNSTQVQDYSFTDKNPINGVSYYRVDQYDYNGEHRSSPMKSVVFDNTFRSEIELFPNPSDNQVTVRSSEQINEVCILSISGAVVQEIELSNSQKNEISFTVAHLTNGVYFIRVNGESYLFSKAGN